MPNPAMGLTEADLTPAQSTGTRLGSALGGLARVGMQDSFSFNQRALAAAYEQQEAERRRIAQERERQGMADVAALGVGAATLGLGAAPALAGLAGMTAGSIAGRGVTPNPMAGGLIQLGGGARDLGQETAQPMNAQEFEDRIRRQQFRGGR